MFVIDDVLFASPAVPISNTNKTANTEEAVGGGKSTSKSFVPKCYMIKIDLSILLLGERTWSDC